MPWLRVDDTALVHPKVLHLRELETDTVTAERVVGWVMLCASWSAQQLTDCWLPEAAGRLASPDAWQDLAAAAVRVGMLRRKKVAGRAGWLVVIDDQLFHIMSREEVEKNRASRRTTRQDGPRIAVLLRDGDQCRYCYQTVNPKDNVGKSGRGRQWDHPDPTDRDTFVVSCQSCNGKKADRTPAEAGMELLPAPAWTDRYFHDSTIAWLKKRNVDPWARPDGQSDPAPTSTTTPRPGSQPEPATPARPGTQPEPARAEREPTTATAARHRPTDRPTDQRDRPTATAAQDRHPGRDGPGRVGSPSSVEAPPRARDGPGPRRGRRARRGSRPPREPPGH